MARELELTPVQRAQFDSIMAGRRTQMRALWAPLRPQMDSIQQIARAVGDSTHEQLKRVLKPEQAAKLDAMRERGRKRAEARSRSESGKTKTDKLP
jgi:Spy/CpxP family protein refolding chaperone